MAAVVLANLTVLVFWSSDVQNTVALLLANAALAVAVHWRRRTARRRR